MQEKIKKFLFENRHDVVNLLILFIIFIPLALIYWGHQGHLVIDCGREAYIPSEVLGGKVLYKDIFNIYGPFAYQLNALFYAVFGKKLETLYFVGLINSALIISVVYFIARFLTSKTVSFTIALFVMVTCVFNDYIFNFVFPYAYAMSYALCGFLLSVLFLMLSVKNKTVEYMPLSFLFLGFSLACKYEYLLYAVFLVVFACFIRPFPKKYIFQSTAALLAVPVLSFSILFLQGMTMDNLFEQLEITKKIMSSASLKYLYSNSAGFYPDYKILILNLVSFIKTFINLGLSFGLIYLFLYVIDVKMPVLKNRKLDRVLKYSTVFIFSLFIGVFIIKNVVNHNTFSWLPIANLLILFVLGLSFIKKGLKNLDFKDKSLVLISFTALLASIKSFFFLNMYVYGSFILPLVFISGVAFFVNFMPEKFKFADKKIWKNATVLVLVVFSAIYAVMGLQKLKYTKNTPVKTENGTVYSSENVAESHIELIDYIKKNTKKDDKILIIPEGPMLNFLTDRPSDNIYNSLVPLYVEVFGEDRIIEDFKNNPPEYVFINNRNTGDYGAEYFCRDYGYNVCYFIFDNYSLEKQIGDEFKTRIYKLRWQSNSL